MENENEIIARTCLTSYATAMWEGYLAPEHVQTLCAHLELIKDGELKRLMVSMPPRHSKSMNVGQYFPAWYMGHHPDHQVIYTSYSQEQATKFGRAVRNQLTDPRYNQIFPNCHISDDSSAKNIFDTLEQGVYKAVGRGGSITGSGANLLIADDMFKDHIEAASETTRNNTIDWYKSVASTRLQKDAAVVLCGTRWNVDDLMGWAEKENADEGWTILNFPALDANNNALWPEMFNAEVLLKTKKRLGPYFWNALYQGRPSALEGNIFKRKQWRTWTSMPVCDYLIQSWDMNFRETKSGSYVVGQIWGYKNPNFFLLDQIRGRWEFMETVKRFVNFTNKWPQTRAKVVEAKANGDAIISMFKNKVSGVHAFNPDEYGSKDARAQIAGIYQDSQNIYLPDPKMQGYEWVEEYIERFASFPNIADKDEIDATAQAIIYLTKGQDGILRLDRLLTGL